MNKSVLGIALFFLFAGSMTSAFGQGPRPPRDHTTTQSSGLDNLLPATNAPIAKPDVSITEENGQRVIRANGIAAHQTGPFPNRGNPNGIRVQNYVFRIPLAPEQLSSVRPVDMPSLFGVGINGVPFDPGAAEWYRGNRRGGWQYEALAGAVPLGIDENYAHVQPTGAYHYHGLPTGLLTSLELDEDKHSPLIGWAADGFPIYARYGYADPEDPASQIIELKSSHQLKSGSRPDGFLDPGGTYDGTFIADYEFVGRSGDLDECNGRRAKTPEFPDGTYAYFLTSTWPVVPRCHVGEPSPDFNKRRPRP